MRHFAVSKKIRQLPLTKRGMPADQNLPLTERECQIILVLSEGITNKEIGRRLGLTEGTVKVHLHRIYRNRPIGAAGIAGHFDGRRQFSQAARSARARRQFQGSSAARLLIL